MRARRFTDGVLMARSVASSQATDKPVETHRAESRRFAPAGALALRPEAFGLVFDGLVENDAHTSDSSSPVAVIEIVGPLMHHEEWWFDSYDGIKSRVRDAVAKETTKCVLLSIDSPGGLVAGCFDTVAELKKICAAAGKKLYAYVDSQATSGGYAMACAAEKIFVPSTGIVGSIGVIDTVMDQTAADQQWGYRFAVIASGARKADGNPHVSISEESISAAQKMVDTLAEQFFELVAKARGLSVDAVKGYQAGLFCGQQAIDAKLADQIATLDEVVAMLAASDVQPEPNSGSHNGDSAMTLAEHKAALKSIADDKDANDSDREDAKKMLAALEGGDGEGEKEPESEADDTDDTKASGKVASEGEGDGEGHEEPDGDEGKKAAADAASGLALAARVQELEKAQQRQAAAAERSKLMASRPDFAPATVAWLKKQPLSVLRTACADPDKGGLPRGPGKSGQVGAARAAITASATLSPEEAAATPDPNLALGKHTHLSAHSKTLDAIMGFSAQSTPIRMEHNTLVLETMTPERAREIVAQKGGAR